MATCSISIAENILECSLGVCLGAVCAGDCGRIYSEKHILMNLNGRWKRFVAFLAEVGVWPRKGVTRGRWSLCSVTQHHGVTAIPSPCWQPSWTTLLHPWLLGCTSATGALPCKEARKRSKPRPSD